MFSLALPHHGGWNCKFNRVVSRFCFSALLLFQLPSLLRSAPAAALPVTGTLPAKSIYQVEGTWVDDHGTSFQLTSLRGEPVVLTLFYTSCQAACPRLVEQMQRIEQALPPSTQPVHFVLLSFDPESDTIAALQAYRRDHHLGTNWILARAAPDDVRMVAMVLGVQYKQEGTMFAHSNLISVLNRDGELIFQHSGFSEDISDFVQTVKRAGR